MVLFPDSSHPCFKVWSHLSLFAFFILTLLQSRIVLSPSVSAMLACVVCSRTPHRVMWSRSFLNVSASVNRFARFRQNRPKSKSQYGKGENFRHGHGGFANRQSEREKKKKDFWLAITPATKSQRRRLFSPTTSIIWRVSNSLPHNNNNLHYNNNVTCNVFNTPSHYTRTSFDGRRPR